MKRTICIVLSCVLALSVCSCKKKEEEPGRTPMPVVINTTGEASTEAPERPPFAENREAFREAVKSVINVSEYDVAESETSVSYNIKKENSKEYHLDYRIHFNDGTALELPVSYQDMEKAGWKTEEAPDTPISNKSQKKITYLNSYGKEVLLWASNPAESEAETTIPLSDSTCYSVSVRNYKGVYETDESGNKKVVYVKNEAPDFSVAGGITQSSSLEEAISIMGKPSNIVYYDESGEIRLFYNEEMEKWNGQLVIEFLADKNVIRKLEYKYTPYHVGNNQEKPAQPTDSSGMTAKQ